MTRDLPGSEDPVRRVGLRARGDQISLVPFLMAPVPEMSQEGEVFLIRFRMDRVRMIGEHRIQCYMICRSQTRNKAEAVLHTPGF